MNEPLFAIGDIVKMSLCYTKAVIAEVIPKPLGEYTYRIRYITSSQISAYTWDEKQLQLFQKGNT
jgi:hypothetical protein